MPVHFSFISQLSEEKAFANKGGIYDNGSIRGGKWFILNLKNNSMLSLCDSSVSLGIDHFATYLKFVNGVTLFPSQYKGNILFGLMDAKGEWVVLPKYKIVNCINEDRAAVFADGKMGFIDTKGKNVLPFNYDLVGTYHNEIVWYKEGKKFGFLNYNGEIVIPAKFEEVGDFYAVK